jgi:hypothetical protein
MFYAIRYDVVGPGLFLLFGLAAFLVFSTQKTLDRNCSPV